MQDYLASAACQIDFETMVSALSGVVSLGIVMETQVRPRPERWSCSLPALLDNNSALKRYFSIELRAGISEARYCAAWYHQRTMIGLTCKGLLIGDDNEGSGGRLSEDIWSLAPRSLGFELKRVIRPAAICVIPALV